MHLLFFLSLWAPPVGKHARISGALHLLQETYSALCCFTVDFFIKFNCHPLSVKPVTPTRILFSDTPAYDTYCRAIFVSTLNIFYLPAFFILRNEKVTKNHKLARIDHIYKVVYMFSTVKWRMLFPTTQ